MSMAMSSFEATRHTGAESLLPLYYFRSGVNDRSPHLIIIIEYIIDISHSTYMCSHETWLELEDESVFIVDVVTIDDVDNATVKPSGCYLEG